MTDRLDASAEPTPGSSKQERFLARILQLLLAIAMLGVLLAFFMPAVRHAGPAARRAHCKDNLRQIDLALRNYAETWKMLPPAYTVDAHGHRLHSWRTLILPYLVPHSSYAKIDLAKPWDDPVNVSIGKELVSAFQCPDADCPASHTVYLAVVGDNHCFQSATPKPWPEIDPHAPKTLMIVEVDSQHAVPWMAPIDADEELVLSLGPKTGLPHEGIFHVAYTDGSVHSLDAAMPATERRALLKGTDNSN